MKLYRARAFLKKPHGGNKAGVAAEASGLTETQMQQIAHEVGYSETAFVLPSKVADYKVRFFTPTSEVDLCGHATIATFNVLRDTGVLSPGLYTQETKAGILKLDVQKEMVYMEQNPPFFGEILKASELEDCFVEIDVIDSRYPIQIVSTGLREIFVPVKSVDLLHRLQANIEAIHTISLR